MNRKIPPDAFSHYFSLGTGRSYKAVAEHYGVSKRAVANLAERENWQARIAELERKAREKSDEKAVETLEDRNNRHLKVLRFIQNKAIETLKATPLESAMDAVRAFAMTIDKERTILGEPSDHMQIDLAQVTREEMRRLLKPVKEEGPQSIEGASPEAVASKESNDDDDDW